MPVPPADIHALLARFVEETPKATAPYFGVNIIDVNESNLASFQERVIPVMGRTVGIDGASVHFNAMSDYGPRKRLVTLIRYDQPFDPDQHSWLFDDSEFLTDMLALGETVEDWRWFTTCEIT